MAKAAQRYGMVVRDQSGAGNGISFFVQDTTAAGSGANPFWAAGRPRPDGYLHGKWPDRLMAQFPWDRVQLLKMNLCSGGSGVTCPWTR